MVPERDQVLAVIRAHRPELLALGVRSLRLFGSVARGDAHVGSDVDLLVEFDGLYSLFDLCRAEEALAGWLGFRVDLVPALQLRHEIQAEVERDAILAA